MGGWMDEPMPPGVHEAELLALIEDELDPGRARALRSRLAAERPQLLARIDRMAADRAALRRVEPVTPPVDLVAALEPMLTRTMLVDDARAPWRPERRHWLAGTAAAAVLGLAAGVWLVSDAFRSPAPRELVIADTTERATTVPPAMRAPDRAIVQSDLSGEVHHAGPTVEGRLSFESLLAASTAPPDVPGFAPAGSANVASFAIVIEAVDVDAARRLLAESVDACTLPAALVRNVSMEEAIAFHRHLETTGGAGSRPSSRTAPRVADVDGGTSASRRAVRDAISAATLDRAISASAPSLGEQIVGAGEHAAEPSIQLELADEGFELSATIDAAELNQLLARLHDRGLSLRLVSRNASGARTERPTALTAWETWRTLTGVSDPRGRRLTVGMTIRSHQSTRRWR